LQHNLVKNNSNYSLKNTHEFQVNIISGIAATTLSPAFTNSRTILCDCWSNL